MALNRYEKIMETDSRGHRRAAAFLAGASRNTRLKAYRRGHDHAFADVLAGVAAPLFVSFGIWLLEQLRRNDIKTAYFLSREGELLLEVARVLNERLRLGLDLRYLYVSRQSVNGGLLTTADEINVSSAITHSSSQTVSRMLGRLGVAPESVREALESFGFCETDWNQPLTRAERKRFVSCLATGELRAHIENVARPIRANIETYLEQEGFFQATPLAVVDTSGNGSQIRALNLLRTDKGLPELVGFQVIRNWNPEVPYQGFPEIHGYIFDNYRQTGFSDVPGLVQMLEIFSTTEYGTVLGYEPRGGIMSPVLDEQASKIHQRCPVRKMRQVILDFTAEVNLSPVERQDFNDLRPDILGAFMEFWEQPSLEEARYWGAFPFQVGDGRETDYPDLAPEMGIADLLRKVRRQENPRFNWTIWPSAAWLRSPPYVRVIYRLLKRLEHWRRTLSAR